MILKPSIYKLRNVKSMSIMSAGIDLSKNVFAVHGVDENGKAVLVKPKVSREQLLPMVAQPDPRQKPYIGKESPQGKEITCRQWAARNHQSAACVDVKRVGPAPGRPDYLQGKPHFPTND